jgi:hypothetical protein
MAVTGADGRVVLQVTGGMFAVQVERRWFGAAVVTGLTAGTSARVELASTSDAILVGTPSLSDQLRASLQARQRAAEAARGYRRAVRRFQRRGQPGEVNRS